MRPCETPRAKRKARLKHWHGHRLELELARTMDKAMLLGELICEKRQRDMRDRLDAAKLPKAQRPKPGTRFNDWGLEVPA